MKGLWTTFLFQPLYNALIFLVSVVPGESVALAIIILTIVVRLILAPLSKRAILTQIKQKEIQPEIDDLRKRITDPQEQSKEILAVYKKAKLNPFSSFLLLLIQLPIIIALYQVFQTGAARAGEMLYPFIQYPEGVSFSILGIIDLSQQSIWLALLAGITQFIQIKLSPSFATGPKKDSQSEQEKMMASFQKNMIFSMPIMITVFAYMLPAAIALYWAVSNIYTLLQELYIRRSYNNGRDRSLEQGI